MVTNAITAQDIYSATVRSLPPDERLKLAALILNDLAQQDVTKIEGYSDSWSEEDMRDATAYSVSHFLANNPEDEDVD